MKKNALSDNQTAVPLAHEELEVGKRTRIVGRTRVRKTVEQKEHVVDEPLVVDEVQIEHVPINRFVDHSPPTRQDGHTIILPVLEEVLVVEKRLLLKEELHITKITKETRKPQKVVLRSEKVVVEHDDLSQ